MCLQLLRHFFFTVSYIVRLPDGILCSSCSSCGLTVGRCFVHIAIRYSARAVALGLM